MSAEPLHGDYQLYLLDNLLIASAQGSWNQAISEHFAEDFKHIGQSLSAPWAHLVLLEQWELAVPEAEQAVSELQQWCIQTGMSHVAQVFSFSPLKQYQLQRMLPAEQHYNKQVFFEVTSATQWLNRQGFSAAKLLFLESDKPSMIQRHFDKVA
ncbi:hypothetical protein SNR37_004126 [Agarivorans aestuarii]|uniref:Uncharacterized protein n=1 Tax=Agarivorans aestuarii TaxID=1563703 RepID=A0ABU7G5L3_9ALTE|nr:hypothetical protein [Agarivorans aestuarii]MEE1674682.1 hypothetical protein [Agarivorans aestuarii]